MNGSHSRSFSGSGNSYRGDSGYRPRMGSRYDSRPSYNKKDHDRENPPTSRCIGVFGLSLRTREKDLLDFFARYGEVEDVNLIYDIKSGRSRGFGFVYFASLNSAINAKERAHGAEIDGNTVRTEFSVTGGPHSPTPGVYLGKSPRRPSFDDRRGGFRDFRDSRGPPPRSFDRRPPFRGRSPPPRMRSRSRSPLSNRRRHIADRTNPPSSRCIGVFGLSTRTRERDLYDEFSRYGVVDNVHMVFDNQTGRSRGFGFVYYTNDKDAALAKDRAHGIEIDGREIRCEFSVTQRPHSPTPGVYLGKSTGDRPQSRSPPMHGRRSRLSRSRSRSLDRRY